MSIQILFNFKDVSFSLPQRRLIKSSVIKLFEDENVLLDSLAFIYCNDKYLHSLNKTFLGHDYLTDVITFPFSPLNAPIQAEIYISVDRVRDNSRVFKRRFLNELFRVMFHGCLHLTGYKDKTKSEKQVMRNREDFYLERHLLLNVPRGTDLQDSK